MPPPTWRRKEGLRGRRKEGLRGRTGSGVFGNGCPRTWVDAVVGGVMGGDPLEASTTAAGGAPGTPGNAKSRMEEALGKGGGSIRIQNRKAQAEAAAVADAAAVAQAVAVSQAQAQATAVAPGRSERSARRTGGPVCGGVPERQHQVR